MADETPNGSTPGFAPANPETPRMWMALLFGEDRQYGGNEGYADDPKHFYRYDSFVPNHTRLQAGDLVLIRGRQATLGVAKIVQIASEPGTKLQRRCPVCRTTGIKQRQHKRPAFRCNDGHEFDTPFDTQASCTLYTAQFGESFIPAPDVLDFQSLKDACPRYNDQGSIQEIAFIAIAKRLLVSVPAVATLLNGWLPVPTPTQDEAGAGASPEGDEFDVPTEDTRQRVLAEIRRRRGQRKFRDALRARYGDRCMISGTAEMQVVEAAHLVRYTGEPSHHPSNGVLLRSDLHTLFDLDLLGIEPATLSIHLHPSLLSGEYAVWGGSKLLCGSEAAPSPKALRFRWQRFLDTKGPIAT